MKLNTQLITVENGASCVKHVYPNCPLKKECLMIATEMFGGPINLFCEFLQKTDDGLVCNYDVPESERYRPPKVSLKCSECEACVKTYGVYSTIYCKKYGKRMERGHCE